MKLAKPSPGLIVEFKAVVAALPQGQPRKMFGYDAVFVNGNMAAGLWQNTCVVKISQTDQAGLIERGLGVAFMPMKGRSMSGWLELSEELAHDPEELLHWVRRAVDFVAALPPKMATKKTLKAGSKVPSRKPAKVVAGKRAKPKPRTKSSKRRV